LMTHPGHSHIYTLSLHDALPISHQPVRFRSSSSPDEHTGRCYGTRPSGRGNVTTAQVAHHWPCGNVLGTWVEASRTNIASAIIERTRPRFNRSSAAR